jgi:hypothetical protein
LGFLLESFAGRFKNGVRQIWFSRSDRKSNEAARLGNHRHQVCATRYFSKHAAYRLNLTQTSTTTYNLPAFH